MRVKQLDLFARTIRLEPGTTKNREGREVTMTAPVFTLLKECIEGKGPDDHVFTRRGKPVADFRKTWWGVCVKAGLGRMLCRRCGASVTGRKCKCGATNLKYVGWLFHDLRRTSARNYRRLGVGETVIMRIGGWKTRSVFERYNIVTQADVVDAVTHSD